MDDEIDISPIFPYTFEVEIKNLQLLTNALASFSGQVDAPWNDGERHSIGLKYSFKQVPAPGLPANLPIRHDARATAIELIIANQILNRIAIYLADATCAAALQRGVPRDDRFLYIDSSVFTPTPDYLQTLFDLSAQVDSTNLRGFAFDVTAIRFESPTKIRAQIGALFISANIALAPVAAPVATGASQIPPIVSAIGSATSAMVAGGALGYQIHIREQDKAEREETVNRKVLYYQIQLRDGNYKPIQNDLRLLGYYDGKIDNNFKKKSLHAVADFAVNENLDPKIAYDDPAFLKALGRRVLRF
ncbi:MAG TPA: putative peptidoglycan binding domain-containing protein [Pseudolabrys sp.]|nr:putative peptidoglycan binding domain-containing protein [Pseudolabrys sp.]